MALPGDLAGDVLRPVSEIGSHPLRIEERERLVEDGAGGLIKQATRFPVWFEPKGEGRTPMCQALQIAREVIGNFIAEHSGLLSSHCHQHYRRHGKRWTPPQAGPRTM